MSIEGVKIGIYTTDDGRVEEVVATDEDGDIIDVPVNGDAIINHVDRLLAELRPARRRAKALRAALEEMRDNRKRFVMMGALGFAQAINAAIADDDEMGNVEARKPEPRKTSPEEVPYMDEDNDPFFPAYAAESLDEERLIYMLHKWKDEPFESPRGMMRRMAGELLVLRGKADECWMIGASSKSDNGGEIYWFKEDAKDAGDYLAKEDDWKELWLFPVFVVGCSRREIHPRGRPERVELDAGS